MKLSEPNKILITGAAGGIGAALAQAYASPGRTLILQGRDLISLQALTRQCERSGAKVETQQVELTDAPQLTDWLKQLQQQAPPDMVIVNAGVSSDVGRLGRGEPWPAIRQVLDVNLISAMSLVETLLPAMRQRGSGQIVLVSSLSAYFGLPLTPSYCASKAALKAYGEALRGWLGPYGIAVNVVLPGFVASTMSERFPGPKPFIMPPQRAATIIKRSLARNRARIAFPAPLSWGMWWLGILPPDLSLWLLRHLGYAPVSHCDPDA